MNKSPEILFDEKVLTYLKVEWIQWLIEKKQRGEPVPVQVSLETLEAQLASMVLERMEK